jgi:hypothetical protein
MEERTRHILIIVAISVFLFMSLINLGGFIWEDSLEWFSAIFTIYIVPALLGIIVGIVFFTSNFFKSMRTLLSKFLSILGGILLMSITTIVSFIILAFFALWSGAVDISS